MLSKNEIIKLHGNITRKKRKTQSCYTYEVKVDKSHLNQTTLSTLKSLFIEAKWFYNYIITQDVFNIDYKIYDVPVLVRKHYEMRHLEYLSGQMKQAIIERIKINIMSLSSKKKDNIKVGYLKFKSKINSIPLKQHGAGYSYRIINNYNIRIQKIKQYLRVNGLSQIPPNSDIANANLIYRNGDYYLKITTYRNKDIQISNDKHIGIDFGINNQLTLSNGIKIQYSVPLNNKLKKLQRKRSNQKFHSKNWHKTKSKILKEYQKVNNTKQDIINKIIYNIKTNYSIVLFQDDNISNWQRYYGSKIQSTSIGGLMSILGQRIHTPVELDRFYPSTQICSNCGNKHKLSLNERVYICFVCNNIIDRDLNSAKNIEHEGLNQLSVPTVRRDFKPVEIEPLLLQLNNIPYVKASLVKETGSIRDNVAHWFEVTHLNNN